MCLTFCGTAKLFSKMAVCHISTSNVFQFFHIFANTYYYLYFLTTAILVECFPFCSLKSYLTRYLKHDMSLIIILNHLRMVETGSLHNVLKIRKFLASLEYLEVLVTGQQLAGAEQRTSIFIIRSLTLGLFFTLIFNIFYLTP